MIASRDPIAELEHAARALEQLPDSDAREWLKRCVGALLVGEDPRSVIGLTDGDYARLRKTRRNYWLFQAYNQLEDNIPTKRCKELLQAIRRFESIFWPRWRDLGEAPSDCSMLHRCIYNALCEWRVPDYRQLYNIMSEMRAGSDFTNTGP